MKELENKNSDIVRLFLEKLEKMNEKERAVLITTIDLLNKPIFVSPNKSS